MFTKRQLGIGYLLGTGVGLLGSLAGYFYLTDSPAIINIVGTVIAGILAGSLLYAGFWLHRSELPPDLVWNIATWSAVGLAIPTFVGVLLSVVRVQARLSYLFPTLFVITIASGGVVGVLLGTVKELRKEHEKALDLNRKNLVMNRVLRHNIRNDMNVLLGYLDRLNGHNGADETAIQPIRRKIQEVVSLSDSARTIETIGNHDAEGPIDIVSITEDRIDSIRSTHDDVTVEQDLPPSAWARADPLLSSVIDNLLENSIEHTSGSPMIRISVINGNDQVIIRVADNGPGIPEREQRILQGDGETDLNHGNGIGLWLVKWVTESYGGTVHFEENDPQGSVVELHIPSAPPPAAATSTGGRGHVYE